MSSLTPLLVFFFTDPATTEIYTLSLHDALPISFALSQKFFKDPSAVGKREPLVILVRKDPAPGIEDHHRLRAGFDLGVRSEEHTSELQSLTNLVCRLLLEKKNTIKNANHRTQPS